MTRSFVIVGQKASASDDFLLEDLPGTSGRIDVLVRCLRATLLSSHGLRRDCIAYLVLLGGPRAPRVLRVDGATAQFIRPDERALGGMVKKTLATHDDEDREGFVQLKPGISMAQGGIEAVLADTAGAAIFVLDEGATDIRTAEIPIGDVVFVAGDHIGLPDDVKATLLAAGAKTVSLGPVSVHADDAVAIAMNERSPRYPRPVTEEETRSLINRAHRDPDAPRPSFSISVVSGQDRGLTFELDGAQASRTLVGVSPACQIKLTDPLVSRRHVAFELETEGLRVQDLGSKNGTIVNGLRVTDALLVGGEVVRVGTTMLRTEKLARMTTARTPAAMAFGRIVGGSPEMRRLYPLLTDLAASTDPVLIEGETGTGKELLAEALHEKGPRGAGPFIVFDCAAQSGQAALAALFGVEGGQTGVFETARGGTLLLDEVAELDKEAQAGLLDALSQSRILREGARDFAPIDVRILVASRRDLDAEVQADRFREDVLQWLAPHRIELPPLRKRQGDVGLLARHFWRVIGGGDALPADFAARLDTYAWPGNVRELANQVARRFANGQEEESATPQADGTDATLGAAMEKILESDMPFSSARAAALGEFEKRYVARVLARHGGHVGRAAAASGIARRYFQVLRGRSR